MWYLASVQVLFTIPKRDVLQTLPHLPKLTKAQHTGGFLRTTVRGRWCPTASGFTGDQCRQAQRSDGEQAVQIAKAGDPNKAAQE